MLRDLLINAFILLTYYLLIGNIVLRRIAHLSPLLRNSIIPGLFSGSLGIMLMYFAFQMEGALLDLRHIPIAVMAIFSNTPALWLCTAIIVLARLFLLQSVGTAVAAAVFIILLGLSSMLLMQLQKSTSVRFVITLLVTTTIQIIWYEQASSGVLFSHIGFVSSFLLISFIAGYLAYLLITNSLKQLQLTQEIEEKNGMLLKQRRVLEDQNEELRMQQEEMNVLIENVQDRNKEIQTTNQQLEEEQINLHKLLVTVQQQEQHYRKLVEWLPDAVFIYQKQRIMYANNHALTLVAATSLEEIKERNVLSFILAEDHEMVLQTAAERRKNKEMHQRIETRVLRLDGRSIDVEFFGREIVFQGQPAMLAIVRDISVRKDAERKLLAVNKTLEMLAHADGLTGIANRRYFDSFFEQEWRTMQKTGMPLTLILLDIDYFKLYNDYYGHQKGDEVLQSVSQTVTDCLGAFNCLFARYGGEEFAILLPNAHCTQAFEVAELIRTAIEGLHIPHARSEVSSFVTSSLGVATAQVGQWQQQADLIEAADQALYTAKRKGRNQAAEAVFTHSKG